MSGTQKALKVISIIVIVLSAITTALGILLFATGVSWRSSVSNPYDAVGGWGMIFGGLAIVFGTFLLIGGIFYLIFGILGLRGANNPSKIGPFFVISIIGLVLAIIGVLSSVGLLFTADLSTTSIVIYGFPLVFMIVCVCLANDIRKIRDGRRESEGARDGVLLMAPSLTVANGKGVFVRDHSSHIAKPRHAAVDCLMERWRFERRREMLPVPEACGRIAARTVRALHQLPSARTSDMDGIGLRFDDFAEGMPDISTWKRGDQWQFCNTGVAMPEGFDTAVAIERTEVSQDDETLLSIEAPTERFECTTEPGASLQEGDVLVRAGEELTPILLSVLNMGGHDSVEVIARPRVAFIPSGSELVDAGSELPIGKNIESNAVMACANVAQWGGEPLRFPIVPDDPKLLLAALTEAREKADIVILNAGSSKGSDDYTCELLEEHGEMLCHEVLQGPGRHCSFSLLEGTPVIGISGPPIGAEFTLDFFVKPFVDLYLSRPLSFPPTVRARMLDAGAPGPSHMTVVKRVAVRRSAQGGFVAWVVSYENRPILRECTGANGLVSVTPDLPGWEPGDEVEIELRWPYEIPPLIGSNE